jgi:two-component system phosphate regulon response regulator PhoB/two-component system alkaline phosphatase synthesis response regulator PhoP
MMSAAHMHAADTRTLVAIVDDEPDILSLVTLHLEKAGFKVRGFDEPGAFATFIKTRVPDLIILDLMLPVMDGLELCKMIRRDDQLASVPIIMLTARVDEADRVLGLELGADDYVTKPFSPRELVARVKAVLRRGRPAPAETQKTIIIGGILEIDPNRMSVSVKKKDIELTHTEYRILMLLASRPGWVFTRDRVLDHLWKHEKAVVDRTVDVHVKHLRDKLGPAGAMVKSVRGAGYKIEA